MSQAPWDLPADWQWRRFGDVAAVASCLTDPAEYPNLPHIAPNHIEPETGKLLPYGTIADDGVTSSKHLFEAGDILYSKIRPYLAKVAIAPSRGLCSADMYPIRTTAALEPTFLRWWMLTREFTRRAAGEQARTVLPKINKQSLYELPVPIPPLDEQCRIVDLLEDHLSRLDAASNLVATSMIRLDALKVAVLQRISDDLHESGVPLVPFGEVADTRLGKMLDSKRATGTATPYLRNINVRWGSVDTIDVKMVRLSDSERHELALREGDLLVCEGGEPGRCAVWPGSDDLMTFQKALHRIRVDNSRLIPQFAATMLEAVVRTGQASGMFTGTTIKHLPQERLRAMLLAVPSLNEQRRVISRVQDVDEHARRLRQELRQLKARSTALRRALLDATFSGRLTGGGTDTEIVEEIAAQQAADLPVPAG